MKFGFRLKIFVVSLGLTVFAFLGADLWLAPAFEEQLLATMRDDRAVLATVLALHASQSSAALDDLARWQALADELGPRAGARVTIVRKDGVVLGDSAVKAPSHGAAENLGARPEVKRALERSAATSGVSESADEHTEYFVATFRRGDEVLGAVRLAFPATAVEAAMTKVERLVLIVSGVVCAATLLLWLGASHWLARLLHRLTAAARKMAGGDLDVRTRIAGTDEVAELGGALDRLAGNLSVAMRELREERDLQVAILDGMQEGVLVLDRERKILRCNPAMRAMLLLSSDAIGRPLTAAVQHPEIDAILDGVRVGDEGARTTEIDVLGLKPRRLQVAAAALPAQPSAVLLVFRDVTDVRRLETMRRDFVANVSHELRTPVASIRSAAETLSGAATRRPEAAGRFLDMVTRNADRLQRLIDDLLDLSRIESNELTLTFERIILGPFVAQVLSSFRERAALRSVELIAACPEGAFVDADARALEQILTNLVDNALKYGAGPAVHVDCAEQGGMTKLRVTDTGPGIAEQHLPRLFERFYRVDAGRARDVGGTGLGLSIVKHLVEAMRGTIVVESTLGKGTTFTVCLVSNRVL